MGGFFGAIGTSSESLRHFQSIGSGLKEVGGGLGMAVVERGETIEEEDEQ